MPDSPSASPQLRDTRGHFLPKTSVKRPAPPTLPKAKSVRSVTRDARGHFVSAVKAEPSVPSAIPKPSPRSPASIDTSARILVGIIAVLVLVFITFIVSRLTLFGGTLAATRLGILRPVGSSQPQKYVFLENTGRVYSMITPPALDLTDYQNHRVLVTGQINEMAGTFKLDSLSQIEITTASPDYPLPTGTPKLPSKPSPKPPK